MSAFLPIFKLNLQPARWSDRSHDLERGRLAKGFRGHPGYSPDGLDAFVAIINPPDPMTLAVGRVADRAIPIEGNITIQPMCTLTLSIDHRVLDGVLGSRFLILVKEHLEKPVGIFGE